MNFTKFQHLFLLLSVTLISTLLFWAAFYFNVPGKIGMGSVSMETIWANYDGPNYLAISKCGYDKDCLRQNFALPMPLEYYTAHFPVFSSYLFNSNAQSVLLMPHLVAKLKLVHFVAPKI